MCLIVAKEKGLPIPKREKLHEWATTHPDGFGVAYNKGGMVYILKGGMDDIGIDNIMDTIESRIRSPKDVDMIFHFRQSTGGGVIPENCHPFPLTRNQKSLSGLDVRTSAAIAHNGVIWEYSTYQKGNWVVSKTGKTDTQQFVEDYLCAIGVKGLCNRGVQDLIVSHTSSKFALLTPDGIHYMGRFETDKGYKYSNGSYKPMVTTVPVSKVPAVQIYRKSAYLNAAYPGTNGTDKLLDVCDACGGTCYANLTEEGDLLCDDCLEMNGAYARWEADESSEVGAELERQWAVADAETAQAVEWTS